ncbi:MAG: hypothetical protein HN672_09785 [Chloroflexi bacterium]|jgi:hypothetical protein|nr:hypothetical protein [Chloroflexota bacterium]MBT7819619.1 hypothetical protein [Chloroflexota bacterium]
MSPFLIFITSLIGVAISTGIGYFLIRWGKGVETQEILGQDQPTEYKKTIQVQGGQYINLNIQPTEKESFDIDLEKDKSLTISIQPDGKVFTEIQPVVGGFSLKGIARKFRIFISKWPLNLAQSLLLGALILYAGTRLIQLESYPIFFFSDEAIQTNLAHDLIRDGFKNYNEEFLPTYFKNVDKYSLGLTVYAQVIPTILFDQSIFLTRATSVVITILGAYWISAILRDIFNIKYWWMGVLFLAISPAWFLHSRTAFETCMMASLYAGFIYYYLRYRQGEVKFLKYSLILGALSFYSYNPGRVVIVLTGFFLLLTDIKYHWENRRTTFKSALLLLVLALPFIRFQLNYPTAQIDQLRLLASYWIKPIPIAEKFQIFFSNWAYGLNPGYWFLSNEQDLSRHLMGKSPHLFSITFIFWVVGLILAIKKIKTPAYRVILIALLVAPSGSAMVGIGITRAMPYIIPATILISLGFGKFVEWVLKKLGDHKSSQRVASLLIFILLGIVSVSMLFNALINGSRWEENYGLSGMQYGAKQLFTRLQEYIDDDPEINFYVSPDWANGTQVLNTYFLRDTPPIEMGNINGYMFNLRPDIVDKTFVMPAEEYEEVLESGKFENIEILEIIPYPNEKPGFYFMRMEYIDSIKEILENEIANRRSLKNESVWINGETVTVKYSPEDMGEIGHLFDNDPNTVVRTIEANPFIIELFLPEKIEIEGVSTIIGSANIHLQVEVYADEGEEPILFETIYQGSVDGPLLILDFSDSISTDHLRILVKDLNQTEPAHIHVWELELDVHNVE